MSIRFEWDPAKNDANQRKHGLRFEDVKAIFLWPSTRRDNIDETYAVAKIASFRSAHCQWPRQRRLD